MIDKSIVEERERIGLVWVVAIAAVTIGGSLCISPFLTISIVLFVVFCALVCGIIGVSIR